MTLNLDQDALLKAGISQEEAEQDIMTDLLKEFPAGRYSITPLQLNSHAGQLCYQVADQVEQEAGAKLRLSTVFANLCKVHTASDARPVKLISNFLAGHTSLESVFLSFASTSEAEEE